MTARATTGDAYRLARVERIDAGDAVLAVRRFGEGPPLLLVHGFPLHGFTWRRVLPELSRHFACVVVDLAGFGDAEWSDATAFGWVDHARRLATVMGRLGLDRYAVLAQDTGGTFARWLAIVDAARVERLVLLNTEMPGHRPPWIPTYQTLLKIPGMTEPFRWLLRSRAYVRSAAAFGGCFADLGLLDGEFTEAFIDPLIRSARRADGMRRYLTGLDCWDDVDALATRHREIRCPVQLVWGEADPTFPIDRARAMVPQFAVARPLVAVPGAKLLVHEERPDDVARHVLAFLRDGAPVPSPAGS